MSDVLVRDVLAAVYAGLDGYLNVRTLPPIEQAFFRVADMDGLEAFVKPRRTKNAYVGAALRLTDTDGSLQGCGPLPIFFTDVDFKDFPDETTARQRLSAAPLLPSLVIQSGGGLQAWWFLDRPMDLQQDAAHAKSYLRRLAAALGADLAAAEPARILRLPNTFNYKYEPPRRVQVEVFEPTRRYALEDFDAWLPAEPPEARVLPGPGPDAVPQGLRNAHLTSLAGAMRRRGMAEASLTAALLTENAARCRPPLPEGEVRQIAKSVGRYAPSPGSDPAFVQSLPELIERAATQDEPRWLVEGLIPGDGTALIHSQPREYKTLIVQALALAVTTRTAAFGLERLQVAEAVPAWYLTEEDGWWRVAHRFRRLVRGYGLEHAPELLHVSAGRGLNLDATEWQERIIASAREQGYRLVILDPLRSVTETADQGPRELKPFALFIRRFMRETGAVVLIVHHDTKPPANATDQRRRPQRASGGGIFSIADSPIHVDRIDEHRRMLVPCAFKFAADPPAITVRLDQGPDWLKLVGEDTTAAQPDEAALDLRILEFLKHSPYTFGNKVALGVKAAKGTVLARLKALAEAGLVDSVEESRGIKWFTSRAS